MDLDLSITETRNFRRVGRVPIFREAAEGFCQDLQR